jgi:hypothetical protein
MEPTGSGGQTVPVSLKPQPTPATSPQPGRLSGAESEVDRLLRKAAEYASEALQGLVDQSTADSEKVRELFYNYVDLACRLEVHFLFPNLGDTERLLLVGLASSRRAIQVGQRNTQHYVYPAQQARHAEAMNAVRQRYLSTRSEVVSRGIGGMLTPLQREVLEREFLHLPAAEPPASAPGRAMSGTLS